MKKLTDEELDKLLDEIFENEKELCGHTTQKGALLC